jgi:hypothetical protein
VGNELWSKLKEAKKRESLTKEERLLIAIMDIPLVWSVTLGDYSQQSIQFQEMSLNIAKEMMIGQISSFYSHHHDRVEIKPARGINIGIEDIRKNHATLKDIFTRLNKDGFGIAMDEYVTYRYLREIGESFELYLRKLVKKAYLHCQEVRDLLCNNADFKITAEELEISDMNSLKERFLEERVDTVVKAGIRGFYGWFFDKTSDKIKFLPSDIVHINALVLIHEIRNIITHHHAVYNKRFLDAYRETVKKLQIHKCSEMKETEKFILRWQGQTIEPDFEFAASLMDSVIAASVEIDKQFHDRFKLNLEDKSELESLEDNSDPTEDQADSDQGNSDNLNSEEKNDHPEGGK